jgi:structural maintenance of chromosome 1
MAGAEQQLVHEQAEARRIQQRREQIDGELETIHARLREARDDKSKSREEEKLVHAISVLKRHFPGVHGRLVDLCRPTNKTYNLAVQTAAGKDMDAVVVDTQKTAFECVQYLRDQRVGSITCLPLDKIQVPTRESTERLAAHISGDARYRLVVDVISVSDPAFQRAVQYAVGNAVVCDDLDAARELCFGRGQQRRGGGSGGGSGGGGASAGPRAKAVTLGGTVITKAGTMTGGIAKDDNKSGRWEDAEIVKLRQRKEQLESERLELDASVEEAGGPAGPRRGLAARPAGPRASSHAQKIEDLKNKLGGLRNRNQYNKSDLEFQKKQLREKEALVASTEKQVAKLVKQAAAAEREVDKVKAAVEQAVVDIKSAEDAIFGPFRDATGVQDLKAYDEAIGKSRDEYNDNKRAMMEHIAQLEQQISYETSRDVQQPIARIEKRIRDRKATLAQAKERREALENELAGIREHLEEAVAAVAKAEEDEKEQEASVAQCQKEVNRIQKERSEISKKISNVDAHLERLRGQLHETLQKARIEEVALPLLDEDGRRRSRSSRASRSSQGTHDEDDPSSDEDEADDSHAHAGTQVATQFSQPDNPVVVRDQSEAARLDFSRLRSSLKQKLTEQEEKHLRKEFEAKIEKIQAEISSMNPNMKVRV